MLLNSIKIGKQSKASKRFLQPPALYSFDILSSMSSQDRQERREERLEVLSNVEEKSYFSCEQSDIKPPECISPFPVTRQLQESLPASQSRKTLRIEDQAIIVVEEEGDLDSNNGEESIILEQVTFKSETQIHENTPNWEQDNQERLRQSGAGYAQGQLWMARECDYASESHMNADFSYSQIRGPNRMSKHTCMDRAEQTELIEFENTLRQTNKSCIARPMGNSKNLREELTGSKSRGIEEDKFYQVRRLLEYGQSYKQAGNIEESVHRLDKQAQTELSGGQLLQNQVYLNEQITLLKSKIKALQGQNARYKQTATDQLNQIAAMTEGAMKDKMIAEIKQQRQVRRVSQLKQIMDRNGELQKIVSLQNTLIKEYQEASKSQAKLSKLESTNTISRSVQKAATFGKQSESLRLFELDVSSGREDRSAHEQCMRETEELHEYIFDLEQRMARVDAEVERKVQAVSQQLEEQISLRCNQEYAAIIESLKDELAQTRDSLRKIEHENRLNVERWSREQTRIKNREIEVCKLYEGLSQGQQRDKEQGRRSRSRPKQVINYYSPKISSKQSREHRQPVKESGIFEGLSFQFSSKDIKQPRSTRDFKNFTRKAGNEYVSDKYRLQNKLFERQFVRLTERLPSSKQLTECRERRDSFKVSLGDVHELSLINHKIQKLRGQITRELDSMQ